MLLNAFTLFGLFAALLAVGAPIAVALGLSALLAVWIGAPEGVVSLVNVLFGVPLRPSLLAIPLFITVGMVLAESSIIRRLIALARHLFGGLPGGLGVVTVVVGMLLAGISGSGPADVAALGTILIPALVKDGLPRPRAAALIATVGSLAIVIPPSIVLILYAFIAQGAVQGWRLNHPDAPDVASPSLERLFLGGVIPGLLMGAALIALVIISSIKERQAGRTRTGTDSSTDGNAAGLGRLLVAALPGLLIPAIILGGIWSSLFTATQAAAVATVYALALELTIYREMRMQALLTSLWAAGRTTAQVMLLVGCASMFSTALVRLELQEPLIGLISQFADSRVVFLIAVNVLVLILGCLIDAVSILFIAVPLVLPAAVSLGVDPVHLGVILTVNLAIGQITPPVGVNLFVAASVAKEDLTAIVREIWPFVAVEVVVLALVSALPALSLVW